MTGAPRGFRVVAVAGASVGLALTAAPALAAPAGAAPTSRSRVPYTDPSATGSIGLCNRAGRQVTSGNISTKPFAWRAVSTQAAAAPYNGAGRTATLYAYQPRRGLTAGTWSGLAFTASSRYSNPAHPMAAATAGDESLKQFMHLFKPQWNGFLQVRMYLGAPGAAAYTTRYPVLNIQITGNRWRAVGGTTLNCRSGTAESLETIVRPTTTTTSSATHTSSFQPESGADPRSSSKGHWS
jgi:hypothetical protein